MSQGYYRGMQDAKQGRQTQEGGDAYLRGYDGYPKRPDAAPPKDRITQFLDGLEFATMQHGDTTYVALADVDRVLADREHLAPPPSDAAPVACEKPLLMAGDAEYLRGLSVGGSHLVSAKWLCDFAQRIENTLAVMK